MGAVVGLVVDALGRRVREQHVHGGQQLQHLPRLLLAPLVAAVGAVTRGAAEAGEAEPAELDPPQLQILRADRRESVRLVVVAAHAELGQIDLGQPCGPGGLEVAQQQDQVGPVRLDELRQRPVRRLVGEREGQQAASPRRA